MTAGADRRRRAAVVLGTSGAVLLGAAGLVQATLGAVLPDLTGAKLAPVGLGLLTVALAVLALAAARRFRRSGLPAGPRAAWALALAVPGLLCLTTVGALAWLPAALLVPAGVLGVVDGWRDSARAVAEHRAEALLTATGCAIALTAAAAPAWLTALGALSGAALGLAAWLPRLPAAGRVALAVLGTVPFALAGWWAVVPVVLAVVAAPLVVAVARPPVRT